MYKIKQQIRVSIKYQYRVALFTVTLCGGLTHTTNTLPTIQPAAASAFGASAHLNPTVTSASIGPALQQLPSDLQLGGCAYEEPGVASWQEQIRPQRARGARAE